MSSTGYGSDRHAYINGIRHRTGRVLTIQPIVEPRESNSAFERRMDLACRQLHAMQSVIDVQLTLERRDGALVGCLIDVSYTPHPEAIADDLRDAGGRVGGRGARGGGQ